MSYKTEQAYLLIWGKRLMAIDKLGGACESCGEKDFRVLEIHHKERDTKDFTFSVLKASRWSLLEKELPKCILMCRNHHCEFHNRNQLGWKKNLLDMMGSPVCSRCGYRGINESSLDFHHINEKNFRVANGYKGDRLLVPIEALLSEIKKCVVLCRNCHGLEHLDKERLSISMPRIRLKMEHYKERPVPMDKLEVVKMNQSGMGVCEIARRTGYCKSTVSMILSTIRSNGGVAEWLLRSA